MSSPAATSFLAFRKRQMLFLLTGLIVAGMGLKFLNLLITYVSQGNAAYLEDIYGMSLMTFARGVGWESALSVGARATMAGFVGAAMLVLINRMPAQSTGLHDIGLQQVKREGWVYAVLFAGVFAFSTLFGAGFHFIALTHFAPLLIITLFNPIWGTRYAKTRLISGVGLALTSFALAGSKTIFFYTFLALTLSHLFREKRSIKALLPLLILVIIYPYLNIFRSFSETNGVGNAAAIALLAFQQDLAANGLIEFMLKPYSLILDRLIGLDGLLVATSLSGITFQNRAELSFELVGIQGVGISLGLAGQFYLTHQDVDLALFLYVLVVAASWRFVTVLDALFARLGFLSIGTYIYIKAIQVVVGGFRVADMKITFSTLGTVLFSAIVIHYLVRQKARPISFRWT